MLPHYNNKRDKINGIILTHKYKCNAVRADIGSLRCLEIYLREF